MGVSLAFPWALWLLLVILLLPRSRGWPWRYLALALLVVALAQPQLGQPSREVAVLVDVSDSVGNEALAALARFDFSDLPQSPLHFYFAGDTAAAPMPIERRALLQPERTDLARALQVAAATEGVRRILLLSDGAESAGDALRALPNIPVDTYRVTPRPNARLVALLAPEQASPGETVQVVAVVDSSQAADLTLHITLGQQATQLHRQIPAGRTPLLLNFVAGGEDLSLTARLEVDFNQPIVDDSKQVEIIVNRQPPVLVIGDPVMAALLTAQGFTIQEGGPSALTPPLNYSAIVLRAGAQAFTPGQLVLLRDYVSNGGGLLMTGGPESFGLGAWYRTPVEEVLPVNSNLRTDVEIPLVAMVLVIDRSQSMAAGRPTRLALAQQGAIDVVDLAYQEDLLGLIVFSDQSEWVFPLRQATEQGKREMVAKILGIELQGGTIFEPAYREAISALAETTAAIKHIIVLSDGEFFDGRGPFARSGTPPDFAAMAAAALAQGITTTTIAIGEVGAGQLLAIARAGGGRFYPAFDAATLPQIFTSEVLTATRLFLREGTLAPLARRHPLLLGLAEAPPAIDAYIATSLKPDGEVLLEGHSGEPILAVRRQGLGRSAALTTDLSGWAGAFGRWPDLPGLLGTVVRWLKTSPAQYSVAVTPIGNQLRIAVDAVKDGQYLNSQHLEVHYAGLTQTLTQVAPGRYEALIEAPPGGGNLLIISGSEVVARTAVSPPNAEFDQTGAVLLLQEIARQTGGEVIAVPGRYAPPAGSLLTPVWWVLALAGLALFVLELLWRRLAGLFYPRPIRPLAG
ncbi:MAG: VWA domain-containing protein [Truepera sp.]|nr:VWA domain-containing protein [Truepera sp.]